MNIGEASWVNELFRCVQGGDLSGVKWWLGRLAGRAHDGLTFGVSNEEVEDWAADLPGYLLLGDPTAARAGDWGWLEISDDCRPANLVDVLLCWANSEGEDTVSIGYRDPAGRYLITDARTLWIEPRSWMPLPGPRVQEKRS